MAKIFETSQDIAELAQNKFEDTGLAQVGIDLKIISTAKAKTVLKVTKANPTTQFLTKKDAFLVIYEEAFDRLSDDYKQKLMEGAMSSISYDSEKDKLNVDGDQLRELFRMRRKYPNYADIVEASYIVVEEIEEEEKRRKEEEKLRKAEERAAKKRAKEQG